MDFLNNDKVEPTVEETLDNLMVPVEPYLENKIQEFGMNGEEQYVQNASISEKLLHLSGKIDYSFVIAPENKEDKDKKMYPWQDVIKSLSSAYTEVCVLSDLMAMLQQRQYLMLDPVEQTKPPYLPAHVLVSKKKGLQDAANILRIGVKSLRGGDTVIDIGKFHQSLSLLNSRFKLRKQGTFILGDASYQTSGSRFQHEALFEVVRDDKCEGGLRIELDPSIKMTTFITISYNQVCEAKVKVPRYWKSRPYTHRTLLTTLHSLFCRELFYMLSVECFKFRTIPCRVVDNVLSIPTGDRTLYITKHTGPQLPSTEGEEGALSIHEICIQHHLHQIHTSEEPGHDEQFYSTMFGIVNNKARPRSLFEFTLIHAQHEELVVKVLDKLDIFSGSVSDPIITVNIGPVSTPYESSINVTLTPSSRNVITNRCVLRLTLNNPYMCVQLDSSLTGPVYTGKDLNLLMEALQQQARIFISVMIKTILLLNNWSILSLDSRAKEEFIHSRCQDKSIALYVTIDEALTPHLVVSSQTEEDYTLNWAQIPGKDIVHKLFTVLNVIAGPSMT